MRCAHPALLANGVCGPDEAQRNPKLFCRAFPDSAAAWQHPDYLPSFFHPSPVPRWITRSSARTELAAKSGVPARRA